MTTDAELFAQYRSAVAEMRKRGLVRSENIAGDWAETLVARAFRRHAGRWFNQVV